MDNVVRLLREASSLLKTASEPTEKKASDWLNQEAQAGLFSQVRLTDYLDAIKGKD